jgi:hypothetical protein
MIYGKPLSSSDNSHPNDFQGACDRPVAPFADRPYQ